MSILTETSWPVVVLWGLLSSQGFFGFGHHPTVVSLRFEAGFVGLHGEMSGLNLLFAGLLVGINMLGSQVRLPPHMYIHTLSWWLFVGALMCVFAFCLLCRFCWASVCPCYLQWLNERRWPFLLRDC